MIETCPTCEETLAPKGLPPAYERCAAPWPPTLADVEPVRCVLPRGHRSHDHWHPPLWPGQGPVLWLDDDEAPR
jgi:hypothetical protein